MEFVNCLLCDHDRYRVCYSGRDYLLNQLSEEFTFVQCCRCGFVYLNPRPARDVLARYYPADYAPFRLPITEERSIVRRLERLYGLRKRAGIVLGQLSKGSLLDVGCGTGDFLWEMSRRPGWKVQGIEPSEEASEKARSAYGLRVDTAYLDQAVLDEASFDAITFWDVFEHLPDPKRELAHVYELLRPRGIAVLGLPDRESFDARIFGPYWAGLDVPRHFSVFSKTDVIRALRNAGFESVKILNMNGSYHSFLLSVRFWLRGSGKPEWAQHLVASALASIPFRALTAPYFRFVQSIQRGGTMVVIGRKPRSS